jgi:argininosuccinate synthase
MDRNLLHISFEAASSRTRGSTRARRKAREMYMLSVSPEEAPDKAEHVELIFEKGICTGIGYHELDALLANWHPGEPKYDSDNHALLSPLWVMKVLNKLGGRHGIGRVDWSRTASSA